jgi:DnaJ-class molecular chaperone
MGSKKDKCVPEGDRWLQKIACVRCKGAGKKTTHEKIKCIQCSGVGYVEDIKKNDVLCQKCKGRRVITQKSETACVDCKGKGYLPKIMQRFLCDETCECCSGEGLEKVETGECVECERCDGMGWLYPAQIYSLADWKKSPDHERAYEDEGNLRTSSGARLIFETCDKCHNHPEKTCSQCGVARRMLEINPGCTECCGTGNVSELKDITCTACDGDGYTSYYETREV